MEARKLKPQHVGETLSGDLDAITAKLTERTVDEWQEEFKRRLLDDIEHGRLNPDKWFLLSQINGLAMRYGFAAEDDLQLGKVSVDVMRSYHNLELRADPANGPAKSMIAVRLNPDKYGHLASIYGRKRMRKLV